MLEMGAGPTSNGDVEKDPIPHRQSDTAEAIIHLYLQWISRRGEHSRWHRECPTKN